MNTCPLTYAICLGILGTFAIGAQTMPPEPFSGSPALTEQNAGGALKTLPFRTLDIGSHSGCLNDAKMVIDNKIEWQRVWNKHSEGSDMKMSAPEVDFSHQVVVALMLGRRPGNAWIDAVQVVQGKEDVTVYYELERGQLGASTWSQAFHFMVIEKPAQKIRFADADQECAVCVIHDK